MTEAFIETMDLYFSEIKGESSKGINPQNLEEILKIAKSQGVYYYVILALKRLYDEKRLTLSEQDIKNIKTVLFNASTANTNKLVMFSDILKQFEEAGIECCVLKGESLARFYYEPAFRISGDIDVLVSPENEEKAIDILRINGFDVKIRTGGSPHDVCTHKDIGNVELHVMLYYDFMEDVWFNNLNMIEEEFIAVNSDNGYNYLSLGITDGFIHTFLHSVEHFLTDGMGLRHISDVLLYLKKHKNEIDFERVNYVLSTLKYKKFLDLIIGVGLSYCGFKEEDFCKVIYGSKVCEKLINDMSKFGIYGKKIAGSAFYKRYTVLRFNTFKEGSHSKYMSGWRRKNIVEFASFSPKNLKKRYPEMSFVEACYMHIKEISKKIHKKKHIIKEGFVYDEKNKDMFKDREEILKELDMI